MAQRNTVQAHFRQGGWVHYDHPEHPLLLQTLRQVKPLPKPLSGGLVVAEAGLLQSYLEEISDLMWDVLEHTERELWMQAPGGRNVPAELLEADGSLSVHWSQQGDLHQLVQPTGQPAVAWWLPSEHQERAAVLGPLENVVTLPPAKKTGSGWRHMRMEPNGAVQILK